MRKLKFRFTQKFRIAVHTYLCTDIQIYIVMYMLIYIHNQRFSKVCKITIIPLEILHSQIGTVDVGNFVFVVKLLTQKKL